jgi:hypothetical protein
MPTEKLFSQCPEFPSTVPVADLPILLLDKLCEDDEDETKKLFDACREYGFFLLDLRSSKAGETLLHDAERMFELTTTTLNLNQSVLDKYAYNPPKDLLGYVTHENPLLRYLEPSDVYPKIQTRWQAANR